MSFNPSVLAHKGGIITDIGHRRQFPAVYDKRRHINTVRRHSHPPGNKQVGRCKTDSIAPPVTRHDFPGYFKGMSEKLPDFFHLPVFHQAPDNRTADRVPSRRRRH